MYLLLIIILLILVLEALYEAKKGDKHHWPSLTASLLITAAFIYFLIPEQSIHLWLAWFWYYASIRSIFDYMYNHFRGMPFHYLGDTAKTDKLLRKIRSRMRPSQFTLLRLGATLLLFIFFLGQLHRYYETTANLQRFEGLLTIFVFAGMSLVGLYLYFYKFQKHD